MAYVNVLSGVSSSLANMVKNLSTSKHTDVNTKIDIVSTTLGDMSTYLQHFAIEQSKFATNTSLQLDKIEKQINYINKRISPKIFTIGKGKNEQSVKYDPLAPEGRQVTVLTGSGKSGRLASKKGGATSEYNQALSKAAYSSNSESDSTPISVKPKMTAAGSTKEERAALYKKLSYETREDDPVYLLKVSMEENFKKVFDTLEEIKSQINSNKSILPNIPIPIPRRGGKTPLPFRGIRGILTGLAVIGATKYGLDKYNAYRSMNPNRKSSDALTDIGVNLGVGGGVGGAVGVYGAIKTKKAFKTYRAAERLAMMRKVNPGAMRATGKQKTIWKLFLKFLEKRAPKIFAKIGARLAGSAFLAGIPLFGWVTLLAVDTFFLISTLFDVYTLWQEFNQLTDAEKQQFSSDEEINAFTGGVAPRAAAGNRPKSPAYRGSPMGGPMLPPINTTQQTTAPQTTAAAPLPQKTAESMELINAPPGTPGAVPEEFIGGMGKDLSKYIVKAKASVNIDGLNPMLKDRMAAMAKEYYDLTKRKIQVNSGFRTYQQQAALYKELGPGKAAPPGRSRHESGLAIDINSSDGNKLAALGLLKKYGFVRPVSNEAWHVEPKETAKRGGGIPDNPYNPGQPIAVPDKNGNAVSPDTGKKLSESELDKTVKNNIDLSAVNTPSASPTPTISPSPADSAVLTSTETNTSVMPAATAAIQEISSIPPTPAVATATAAAPSQVASGSSISQQSSTLEQNKLAAAVQPVINNVIPMAPPVQCRFQPQKPANLPEASIDNGDTTIKTMFARDRWA